MQTIYEPKGKAKEYGELALNIYTGCTHGCTYCYAPSVLRRDKTDFTANVQPRVNILEETKKRLSKGDIKDKEIFLCFTCDPFPIGADCTETYRIIKTIKDSGNRVAILTKGKIDCQLLFSLLDSKDRFGVTLSCNSQIATSFEPNAESPTRRLDYLRKAKKYGVKTFVSCEPVLQQSFVYQLITMEENFIDEYRIGKLNYHDSPIDWKEFGKTCEYLCQTHNRNYLIKEGLREEMEK
jgi:DNA repair photolyase